MATTIRQQDWLRKDSLAAPSWGCPAHTAPADTVTAAVTTHARPRAYCTRATFLKGREI
jgi:hypothetical protein